MVTRADSYLCGSVPVTSMTKVVGALQALQFVCARRICALGIFVQRDFEFGDAISIGYQPGFVDRSPGFIEGTGLDAITDPRGRDALTPQSLKFGEKGGNVCGNRSVDQRSTLLSHRQYKIRKIQRCCRCRTVIRRRFNTMTPTDRTRWFLRPSLD